jgi:tight adherence protein B
MVSSGTVFQKIFSSAGNPEHEARLRELSDLLDRAGMQQQPQQIALAIIGVAAVLWIALDVLMRPSLLIGALLLPLCAGVSMTGFWAVLQIKIRKRLDQFVQQLEMALRLMGSGVRIGLGLRQALAMVIEEMEDPARYEYRRVVGQTNIGVSVYDALDTLAKRMPSGETMMMARAIRIQSQTGGDLGKILEHLANTIKERRRIQRKISALTAEGRASAAILSGLPPFLSGFISLTEPAMGHALWLTTPGHIALLIVGVLETLGVFTLMRMLKVDV